MRRKVVVALSLTLFGLAARPGEPAAPAPAPQSDTALGKLAAATKPGPFALLNQAGDANGTVTRLKDGPASITVYINQLLAAVDPVSGDCIFVAAVLGKELNDYTGEVELWKHDISADTWTQLDAKVVPDTAAWWTRKGSPFAVVVTPISKYGVIMFMSAAGRKSRVCLYKHAQASMKERPE